jgi:hypothetical protein
MTDDRGNFLIGHRASGIDHDPHQGSDFGKSPAASGKGAGAGGGTIGPGVTGIGGAANAVGPMGIASWK